MPLTMQVYWYGDGGSRKSEVKHISEFLAEESASVTSSKSPFCFEKGEVNGQVDMGMQMENIQVATLPKQDSDAFKLNLNCKN